jgi:hypothetical protein
MGLHRPQATDPAQRGIQIPAKNNIGK